MHQMTIDEILILAKITAYAFGDKSISLTQMDKDLAVNILKRMADQRWDWTEWQKEQYKALADLWKSGGTQYEQL